MEALGIVFITIGIVFMIPLLSFGIGLINSILENRKEERHRRTLTEGAIFIDERDGKLGIITENINNVLFYVQLEGSSRRLLKTMSFVRSYKVIDIDDPSHEKYKERWITHLLEV